MCWRRGQSMLGSCVMKFAPAFGSASLGIGNRLRIAWPRESIRFAGMRFPGNACPVAGSMTGTSVPLGRQTARNPHALQRGRYPVEAQQVDSLRLRVVDDVEEEQPVAVGVDALDLRDRTADRSAEVRISILRLRTIVDLVEVVDRVPRLVAFVPIRGAVVFGAAVLGDHVDLRAAFEAVLCGVGAHLDVDLGDRVHDRRAAQRAAAATVTAVDAVDINSLAASALH